MGVILYKISIRPLASYLSPLQSDTFFGAFCWSYRYLYGEERLADLLSVGLVGGPKIIFSNAYPSGYLPLPMGYRDEGRTGYDAADKQEARAAYQQNKIYKKCSLISREGFRMFQTGDVCGYSQYLAQEEVCESGVMHNTVNRGAGTVQKTKGQGSLYVKNELRAPEGMTYDVYILTSLELGLLREVLTLMLTLGIGGSKSTGKGEFALVGDLTEERELLTCGEANGFTALSNFIPAASDPAGGWYKTMVKFGKTDREYAASETPFKKPLLYLQAGAVFRTDAVREYYGRIVTGVSQFPGVVVNACTIAVPVRVPERS